MNAVPHKSPDGKIVRIFHFPRLRWQRPSAPPVGDLASFGGFSPGVHTRPAALEPCASATTTEWRLLWIALALLCIAFACSSCTVMEGNKTAGTYSYRSFAGNAKIGSITPDGAQGVEIDNATGLGVVERTADKIGKAWMWGKAWDAAGNLIDRGFDALEDGNETDVRINANNNATKETIETFVPPEPEIPAQ